MPEPDPQLSVPNSAETVQPLPGNQGRASRIVVELRVHGVSGTPPEELLDRPLVRQVAGDTTAGFYRPRLREEWRDRPTYDRGTDTTPYSVAAESDPPPLLEGYSWGGLTSGSPSRALWLILVPFTLINVAPRLRPVPGDRPDDYRRCAWSVWFLSRVMAVSLTVTLTLGAVGVGLGTFAWQCQTACQHLPWPLSAMFVGTSPGWRVFWGSLLPLLVLAVLAVLSWRKSVQYDLIRPPEMDRVDTDPVETGTPAEPRLGDPSFWYGRYPVSRLRHLHLQAGVGVVGLSLALASPSSAGRAIGIGLGVLTVVLIAAGLAWPGLLSRSDPTGRHPESFLARTANTGWILLIWLPVLGLLIMGWLLPHGAAGEMSGYGGTITVWFAFQSVLALLMLVLIGIMALAEGKRTPRRAMWGLGSVVITIIALYLGAALTSGLVVLTAAWITSSTLWISIGDVETLLAPGNQIVIPDSLKYAGLGTFAVAVVITVVVMIIAVVLLVIWLRGGAPADLRHARDAEDRALRNRPYDHIGVIKRRRKAVSRAIWLARRVDYLPGYLAAVVLTIGVIGSIATLFYSFGIRLQPADVAWLGDNKLWSALGIGPIDPVAVGVWLIGILLFGLVVLGALAFRIPKTRKSVGILWDLGSFWPRDVHPLAPPCYAERAVPELGRRMLEHAELVGQGPAGDGKADPAAHDHQARNDDAGLVVLAGHSQGTVISMAALLGPGRDAAGVTAFLTFGTVLRRLYARFFPLYFSTAAFAAVTSRLGEPHRTAGPDPWAGPSAGLVSDRLRWRNLWRRTDYLGGRLGDPLAADAPKVTARTGEVQIDVELTDPQFLPGRGDSTMPAAGRHSNFPRDPEFQAVMASLVRLSFATRQTTGAPPAPALPGPAPTRLPTPDDLMNPSESMG